MYYFLFTLLGVVYLIGLFVPLMDNDAAHHANIALHMHITGDYVSLVDHAGDYLDKPHLHFWLAALSYKIFGVSSFAYRFPSFLFTIAGVYSTYRLGKMLYDKETGKLAALLLASSFAFILANTDVRMEAILTSCIAFSLWQLVEVVQYKKISNVVLAALGLALGFSTKGHIAVFVPAVGIVFYLLYLGQWKHLLDWRWLVLILLFGIFIMPVVYCYYLQFNLHPEKIVRGKDHINGVKFILLNQSIERFGGTMGNDAKHDYLFFIHSFLWAFAPWSIIAYTGVIKNIRAYRSKKTEWMTTGIFMVMLIVVSFSGFKLPHYLNIVFPATAVMTAGFIQSKRYETNWNRSIYLVQQIICILLLLGITSLNSWAFPIKKVIVFAGLILLLALVFYFYKSGLYSRIQKATGISVATMLLSFFLLNANFYPQLLSYQGGNELAKKINGKIDPADVYYWGGMQSSSFGFYTRTLRKQFMPDVLDSSGSPWLLYDIHQLPEINAAGYIVDSTYTARDHEITKLKLKFLNPAKRDSLCTRMILGRVSRK